MEANMLIGIDTSFLANSKYPGKTIIGIGLVPSITLFR